MSKPLQIIVPMAGLGSRFKDQGYTIAKPFIDVNGKMMIERVLGGVSIPSARITLIVQHDFYNLYASELNSLKDKFDVNFASVDGLTMGAACTVLSVHKIINNANPLLIVDSDNVFIPNEIYQFVADAMKRNEDGSLLTIASQNPAFSYVRTDQVGHVIETKEKDVISSHAICGAYFYARGELFCDAAIQMMIYGDRQKNEFYVSNTYNYLIKKKYVIGHFEIPANHVNFLGTPDQLKAYLNERSST